MEAAVIIQIDQNTVDIMTSQLIEHAASYKASETDDCGLNDTL
jgi:hypothetical protein